jgi:hypothetical protein
MEEEQSHKVNEQRLLPFFLLFLSFKLLKIWGNFNLVLAAGLIVERDRALPDESVDITYLTKLFLAYHRVPLRLIALNIMQWNLETFIHSPILVRLIHL